MNDGQRYRPGDCVIYRLHKHSASPGPRAKEVAPEPNGEEYSYCVDKYWTVTSVEGELLRLVTRRGKHRTVAADDPNLRLASWWERLFLRERFPQMDNLATARPA